MKLSRRFLAGLALTSAALAAPVAHSIAQDSEFFFRFKGNVDYVGNPGGGAGGPGDVEDEAPFGVSGGLPSQVMAEETAEAMLTATGLPEGATASFAPGEGVPEFMTVSANGRIILDPISTDVGTYEGIHVKASSGGVTKVVGPLTLRVLAVNVSPVYPAPVAAYLNGQSFPPQVVFDDAKMRSASYVGFGGTAGNELVLKFKEPLSAKHAYLHTTGTRSEVKIDALIGGEWREVLTRSSPSYGNTGSFLGNTAYVSDTWRVRHPGTANVVLHEFRPGYAPANPPPVFRTKEGPVVVKGYPFRFQAYSPSKYYSDAPVTFSFPKGFEPPEGVTLTAEGELYVDPAAAIPNIWQFQVAATDGIGFSTTGTFSAVSDVPSAATVMATDIAGPSGEPLDHRLFYDGGATSVARLAPGDAITIDFGQLVSFQDFALQAMNGEAVAPSSNRLWFDVEKEEEGTWRKIGEYAYTLAATNGVTKAAVNELTVGSRFRIVSKSRFDIGELRLGNGAKHENPILSTYQFQMPKIDAAPQTFAMQGQPGSSPYSAGPVKFEVVGGALPSGSHLEVDGTLRLSSLSEAPDHPFNFTLRLTDSLGFYTEQDLAIWGPYSRRGQTVMAEAYAADGTRLDNRILYDGLTADTAPSIDLNAGDNVVLDFGEPVYLYNAAKSVTTQITPGYYPRYSAYYWASGRWNHYYTYSGIGTDNGSGMGSLIIARYVKLEAEADIAIREMRLDQGPAITAPQIQQSGIVAYLGTEPSGVQLTATRSTAYSQGPLYFDIVSDNPPAGFALSTSGYLSVPADFEAEVDQWTFQVRVTDPLGFSTVKDLSVSRPAVAAASWMATDFRVDGSPVDHKRFYDGKILTADAPESAAVPANGELVVDFGRVVKASNVFFAGARTTATNASLGFYAEVNGEWVSLGSPNAVLGSNSSGTHTFAETAFRRFKFVPSHPAEIRELRVGNPNGYTGPAFSTHGFVATLSDVPTEYAFATAALPFVNGSKSFELVEGSLPVGTTFSGGKLLLPRSAEAGQGPWAALIRLKDGLGFQDEKWFAINPPAPTAADFYPATAYVDGIEVPVGPLYDGLNSTNSPGYTGSSFEVHFSQPVRSHYVTWTISTLSSSEYFQFEARVAGNWIAIRADHPILAGSGTLSHSSTPAVADAFRIRRTAPFKVTELRFGQAPAHKGPAFTSPAGQIATLQPAASRVQIVADPQTYPTPLQFKKIEGSFPTGADLSTDGMLDLPPSGSVAPGFWTFRIEVMDGHGYSATRDFWVVNNGQPVNQSSASYFVNGADIGPQPLLTDGTTSGSVILEPGQSLLVDFGAPSSFSRFSYHVARFTPSYPRFKLFHESADGTWFLIADKSSTTSSAENFTGMIGPGVTRRVRLEAVDRIDIRELRYFNP